VREEGAESLEEGTTVGLSVGRCATVLILLKEEEADKRKEDGSDAAVGVRDGIELVARRRDLPVEDKGQ
jgi:hypothetical protein